MPKADWRKTTPGLVHSKDKPKPPASPAGFRWPETVDRDQYSHFSTAVRELANAKDESLNDMGRVVFGKNTGGMPRSNKISHWIKNDGKKFASELEAGHIAAYYNVPMSRLLQANGKVDPVIREAVEHLLPKPARKKHARKVNGHDQEEDHRWVLPAGEQPPQIELKTATGTGMSLKIDAKWVPPHVAMAVMNMLQDRRDEPIEHPAAVEPRMAV